MNGNNGGCDGPRDEESNGGANGGHGQRRTFEDSSFFTPPSGSSSARRIATLEGYRSIHSAATVILEAEEQEEVGEWTNFMRNRFSVAGARGNGDGAYPMSMHSTVSPRFREIVRNRAGHQRQQQLHQQYQPQPQHYRQYQQQPQHYQQQLQQLQQLQQQQQPMGGTTINVGCTITNNYYLGNAGQ